VEPFEGNESALGLDVLRVGSAPTVERSRDTGVVQLTGPIRLVQEAGSQMGVVLYVPYYDESLLGSEPVEADRQKAFQGVFQLVFRGEDMLSKLLDTDIVRQTEQLPRDIASETNTVANPTSNPRELFGGMDLLVEDVAAEEKTLFFRPAPLRKEGAELTEEEFRQREGTSRSIQFAGRHWRVQFGAAPEFMKSHRSFNAQGTAMSGLAFTVLMLSYVLMLQRKARDVNELVEIRTGGLERSYGQLEHRQERLSKVNVTMAELSHLETAGEFGLDQYLRKICEAVAERFEIDRVGVWLFSAKRDDLRCEYMYTLRNQRWTKGRVLTAGEFPGYFEALDSGLQINAVNARLDRRTGGMTEDYLEPENIFSLLNAPIRRGGQLVGVVSYDALGKHRRWSQEESTLAGAVADFVTLALIDDERWAAESRLRESERLYHSLVENLPQFVFRKDLDGKFTFVNEQLCEGFGKEETEILGHTDDELSPPELAKKYRADDRRVIEKGEVLEFVEEIQLATGRYFLHTCKTPIRDDKGKIVGVQGIAWDITERYRLQDALNASDERFRGLVDSLDCIVWEANPDDMSFAFVSRQAERMLGYPLGMWIDDVEFWTNRIHPEDRELVLKSCRESIAEGEGREFEYRMLAMKERTVWVRNILSLEKDGEGKVTRVRGLMIDTTERRQMQGELQQSTERMRLFIQHTPTSVAMFDTRMRYILASKRWYEDNNLSEGEIIGRSHYDVVPDIPDRWRRVHEHCLLGNSAECEEDMFLRDDGSTEFVRWEIHPWHKGAEVGGIIMFAEMITDRVNARIAIERSEAVLQATGRAAELFLKAQTWSDALVEVMEHLGEATRAGRVWFMQNERGPNDSNSGRLRLEWFSEQGSQEMAGSSVNRLDWNDPAIERWREVLAAGGGVWGH
ncbi:MAG: PAS domain-containing protein, partial [Limisphaerales bacterium]